MIRVSTPLRLTAALLLTAPLAACSAGADPDTLDVLASSTPHAEILEWVDEQHDDITLDVGELGDSVGFAASLDEGTIEVADGVVSGDDITLTEPGSGDSVVVSYDLDC